MKEIEDILATAKLPPGNKAVKKLPPGGVVPGKPYAERAAESIARRIEAIKNEQAAIKAEAVGLTKDQKKEANRQIRDLDVAVKKLEKEQQTMVRLVKNAKTEKVMKFNDIGDDPYVMRPRIQIPIQAQNFFSKNIEMLKSLIESFIDAVCNCFGVARFKPVPRLRREAN